MGIRKSAETGFMVAECDVCGDIVEFGEDEDFEFVKGQIDEDGWQVDRIGKNADAKWINICCDCVDR